MTNLELVEQIKNNPVDPLGWQALGRALKWGEHSSDCQWTTADCGYKNTHMFCPHAEHECNCNGNVEWKLVALRYFELKLTGGDEAKFWEELLKDEGK